MVFINNDSIVSSSCPRATKVRSDRFRRAHFENFSYRSRRFRTETKLLVPALADAYDFKEAFYRIYDEPTKEAAMQTFEAWENTLPAHGLDKFRKLARTVHNHFEDIFAYWDAPYRITNAYTEGLNGLIKVANRMGRGYSYEIIRAKTLYARHARKVGSRLLPPPVAPKDIPTTRTQKHVEYGPHIPTLIEMSETGELE